MKKLIKGKFLFKKEWYSVCSAHRNYNENCSRCNTGRYVNVYFHNISSFIFKHFPKLWIFFANLKNRMR